MASHNSLVCKLQTSERCCLKEIQKEPEEGHPARLTSDLNAHMHVHMYVHSHHTNTHIERSTMPLKPVKAKRGKNLEDERTKTIRGWLMRLKGKHVSVPQGRW